MSMSICSRCGSRPRRPRCSSRNGAAWRRRSFAPQNEDENVSRRWGNGPRSAFQASRACYGAIGWRASRGLPEGGRSSLTLMVLRSQRDKPRSKHQGETTMEHYAGIDVSLECSRVCVVDPNGKIVREAKVAGEPQALIAWVGSLGFGLERIGLE